MTGASVLPWSRLASRLDGLDGATSRRRAIRWMNPGWIAAIAGLALSALGVAAIMTVDPTLAPRQVAYTAVGLVAAALVAIPDYRRLRWAVPLFAVLSLGLLVFVLIPAVPQWLVRPRNGARGWINLGVIDLQPAEVAKVVFILAAAAWLRPDGWHRRLMGFAWPFLLTLVPVALILLEPDLGTATLFLPTLVAMLWCGGARKRHLVALVVAAAVAAPLAYPFLKPHQRARIDALVAQLEGDRRFEQDIGYQSARAMDLVGAGGVEGLRAEAAPLIEHNHLPEAHNDMIFPVIACRWGLVGAAGTLGALAVLVGAGLWTASIARDAFGRMIAVGVASMLGFQAFVNVAMTIGLLPVTGITLPFVSYGGSSMLTTWVMVGLVLNVALRRPPRFSRRGVFEFDGAIA